MAEVLERFRSLTSALVRKNCSADWRQAHGSPGTLDCVRSGGHVAPKTHSDFSHAPEAGAPNDPFLLHGVQT